MTMPAATLTRYQPRQETVSSRLKGTDNLSIISTAAGTNYTLGTEIISGAITARSSIRLGSLSQAFQRIRWNSLAFTVEGAYPTTSGGGYIACFVRDPDDIPPSDPVEAVKWAMAQQHSADAKWYDSVKLMVGMSPDLLFTSPGIAPRLYSPGTLFIISKGGPAQVGALTVNFHWDITLSEPTSEVKAAPTNTWTAPRDFYLPFAPTAALPLSRCNVAAADPHLAALAPETVFTTGLANFSPGTYLRLKEPRPITGEYNTGNDYIPIYISGFTIATNLQLQAVAELGGEFFLISIGSQAVPTTDYQVTNWHLLSGGFGAIVQTGEVLDIFATPQSSKPEFLFRRLPRKAFLPYSRDQLPLEGIDPNVALTNLTGELSRAWPTASLPRS